MEREQLETSAEKPSAHHDERAIAAGVALLSFFVAIKVSLLLWYVIVKQGRPLADVPADGPLYLFGPDLFICLIVACGALVLRRIGDAAGSAGVMVSRVLRGLIYAGIVLFCVASFQVSRIYGEPLDIERIRAADNLVVFRHSMAAYIGPLPIVLAVYGLVCVPLLGGLIAHLLIRRRVLRKTAHLWAVCSIVSIGVAVLAWTRMHAIYTYGVKDNAIVFFLKEYRAPFRPIDGPKLIQAMEQRRGKSLNCKSQVASLTVPGGMLRRDFPRPSGEAKDFNLIVIQMESTGSLHVNRETAPNIVELSERGLNLNRHATVATQTQRATCGIYYSDYLPDMGTELQLVYGRPMPQPALGEVLRAAGYRTAVFQSGFLDYMDIRFMFQGKGMETLVGAREMVEAGAPLACSSSVYEERTVEEIIKWIGQHRNEKFFAAYLTECPHHPYISNAASKPFPDDTWLGKYKNSLHYADQAVGKLVEYLKTEGLLDKTLIVVVGDHGETVSTYPVGHGLRVSAEEIRTPFIVSNPVLFPTSVGSNLSTNHLDVAPTVVKLLGLEAPREWLGRDLLADRIPAVLQFCAITHIKRTVAIDNGLVFAMEDSTHKGHLFELADADLRAVPDSDARHQMCDRYRDQVTWFLDWSAWRHLKRAQGRLPDLAQHEAPAASAEAAPRTASEMIAPQRVPGS